MNTRLMVASTWFALGCGGGAHPPATDGSAGDGACRARLAPRAAPPPRPAAPAPTRSAKPSQVVVHVESSLAPLAQQLEARVQKRLADGRFGIGPGGTVTYTAERGALSLSTTASALVIETPVQARAEACRGASCYASCQPRALVRAEVPLMLGPDYRFARSTVSLRFTQGCKVRALGGFLTVDLTPTIEGQLEPELRKVGREIDRQLPDVRREAENAWRELLLARELPMGACVLLQPSALVQGPFVPSGELLRARFAVMARPELRSSCGEAASAEMPALPPLQVDAALPEEGTVQLGMVTPLAGLARAVTAGRADVTAWGSDVEVSLEATREVCGELLFTASPDYSGEGDAITLARARLGESERQRLLDQDVDPAQLLSQLTAGVKVLPLLSLKGFAEAAPSLARAQSRPELEISAQVSQTKAAGAAARDRELVAWLEARGSVALRTKFPTK